MKYLVGIAIVLGLVGSAILSAQDEVDDIDIIMSDMPLKSSEVPEDWTKGGRQSKKTQDFGLGDHQANDLGPVILIVVEMCNGTAI